MTQLKKYGIHLAILFSAFYFELIHNDLYQGISAGLGGIIFGYVAYRYSLLYSIVLHITSTTFATITSTIKSNDTLSNLLVITIILIALITTLVVGIKYLKNRSSSHLLPQKTSSEHMTAMEKLVSTTSWSIAPNKVGMTPVAAMTISTKQTNKPIKTDCLAIFKNLSSTLSWLLSWTTET